MLYYYEITGSQLPVINKLHLEEKESLKKMSDWIKANLPKIHENFKVCIDFCGLSQIEYFGDLPAGFKKEKNRFISPKRSNPIGKAINEEWKKFKLKNIGEVLEYYDIPMFEILCNMHLFYPLIVCLKEKNFLVTSREYNHPELIPVKEWEYLKAVSEDKENG